MVKILYETRKTNSETIPQVKKHIEEILNFYTRMTKILKLYKETASQRVFKKATNKQTGF
jgi:hypothetical protein